MTRPVDAAVEVARKLIAANETAYVLPDALQLATALVELAEEREWWQPVIEAACAWADAPDATSWDPNDPTSQALAKAVLAARKAARTKETP